MRPYGRKMDKKMLKRMVRMVKPVRIGRKVGKMGIDPFETRFYLRGTDPHLLAGKDSRNVWTKHKHGFIYVGERQEGGLRG